MSRSVNLQRRHFEYIADTLLELKTIVPDELHHQIVEQFIYRLSRTNGNFKCDRFHDRSRGIVKAKPVRVRKAKLSSYDALRAKGEEESFNDSVDTNYWE